MKINVCELSNGVLAKTENIIDIRRNRWIDRHSISHPIKFSNPIVSEDKNVYFLFLYGDDKLPYKGIHISLCFWQNQRFLFMQKKHWLQSEENIRYLINILFLLGGVTLGILNYLK